MSNSVMTRVRQVMRRILETRPSKLPDRLPFRPDDDAVAAKDAATNQDSKINAFDLGLYDTALSGWFNKASGELAPGFPICAEDIIVDVGCGSGGIAGYCALRGAHIILADIDEAKIRRAAEQLAALPARKVETYLTDANPLPLADCSVSRVICMEVLEHVDDPAAIMSELVRIGQPGALYLITVPGALSEHIQVNFALPLYFQKPNHIRIFDDGVLKSLVEDAGLRVEHQASGGFFWSIWWLFSWQFWNPDEAFERQNFSQPLLEAWTTTWSTLLKTENGIKIKHTLDACIPKYQLIVARKPN